MEVKLPSLGESAGAGRVVRIHASPGDHIKADEPLIEIENDKSSAEIPAPQDGEVKEIHVAEGDEVNAGDLIATLEPGESAETEDSADEEESSEEPAEASSEKQKQEEKSSRDDRAPASPSLRHFAREIGLDLEAIQGTGRGGRITRHDLRQYVETLRRDAEETRKRRQPGMPDFGRFGEYSRKPMSGVRKAIAASVTQSWAAVPQVTQFGEADLTRLMAAREKPVSITALLVLTLLPLLKRYPQFNASLNDAAQELILKEYIHLGIAVDTERGLMLPVLRNADRLDRQQLSDAMQDLAARAREGKLESEERTGASFTISNQGPVGGDHFTPIVHHPEVAILGFGRTRSRAVPGEEGSIAARPILPLALSYDHRVIDGADAARFMTDYIAELEKFDVEEEHDA